MATFTLSSSDFKEGQPIPATFSCEGKDISPELGWTATPGNTRSYALTCIDPDAPMGDWIHWIAWDIPADSVALPRDVDQGDQKRLKQGLNSWGRVGYGGPCPPPGHGPHRYYFTLYALDVEHLKLDSRARLKDLTRALKGHILGQTALMGRYERK